MLNEAIDAIIQTLGDIFADDCAYYRENLPEEHTTPCFCVNSLGITGKQLQGTRQRLTRPFEILYYPVSINEPATEIRDVQELLRAGLEYIQMDDGGLLRGTKMQCETVDNVGRFMVEYNINVMTVRNLTFMEVLEKVPSTKK